MDGDQVSLSIEEQCQRLCLAFRNRFNETVAKKVIEDCGGLEEAMRFLMLGSEDDVQRVLRKNKEYVESLRIDSVNVKTILEGGPEDLQFACAICNRMWWKRVPAKKPVSKCYKCRKKYDPIPKEHQWGWGEFACPNGHHFKGFGIMSRTRSKCYKCQLQTEGELLFIIPPKRREDGNPRPKRNRHNCNGINCYRGSEYHQYGGSGSEKPPLCIHPNSPKTDKSTRIHCASREHISTGSTIATFLDQGSLDGRSRSPASSLETIYE